jgi:anionic glutamate receptor
VDLTFKREFSYYLLTIYVPCCMLVIVSWVSFWLDPNAVPARVSLGVTTLLTMSTQTASINNSLPPVAYTKAIDVWTGVNQAKPLHCEHCTLQQASLRISY